MKFSNRYKNIPRSAVYQNIFDDDFMMETFGTLTPEVTRRTAYFFEQWMDWKPNTVKLGRPAPQLYRIKTFLNSMGLKDLREYQIRNNEIRFKNSQDLAMAKLNGLQEVIHV